MSAQDRKAEREVADYYADTVRPSLEQTKALEHKPVGTRWNRGKRFIEGFASGYVAARWVRGWF